MQSICATVASQGRSPDGLRPMQQLLTLFHIGLEISESRCASILKGCRLHTREEIRQINEETVICELVNVTTDWRKRDSIREEVSLGATDIFVQVKRRGEGRFNLSTSHETPGVIKRVHPHMSTYVHIASIHLTVAWFALIVSCFSEKGEIRPSKKITPSFPSELPKKPWIS